MPSDQEKLLLAVAGMVARDRLARGVLLNYPETVAVLATWVVERAREGASVADLMAQGSTVLRPEQVLGLTFTRKAAAELSTRIRAALVTAGVVDGRGVDESGEQVVA